MTKTITLQQLKEKILNFYWGGSITEIDKTRPMYILKLKDNYHKYNTYVVSIQGSPPKGRAILTFDYHDCGYLVIIGNNSKITKRYPISVSFEDVKEARAVIFEFDKDILPICQEVA